MKQEPAKEDEQSDNTLVQTIIDEKEELLKEKKNGNKGDFSGLRKKLIENLKRLAPDLSLPLGRKDARKIGGLVPSDDVRGDEVETNPKIQVGEHGASVTAEQLWNNSTDSLEKKVKDKGDIMEGKGKLKDFEGNALQLFIILGYNMDRAYSTAQHSTAQHSTAQHSTAQYSSTICIFVFQVNLKLVQYKIKTSQGRMTTKKK